MSTVPLHTMPMCARISDIKTMKKLIVFLTCQRCGSSVTADIFRRHGVSFGEFSFFNAAPENRYGWYEAMPIFEIDHILHRVIYGFREDSIHYELAGTIMKNRNLLRPTARQIHPELIQQGRAVIQRLVSAGQISAYKHPASVLFWFYWTHVFSGIPELEVHPVFLLRPPSGIAASYARRAKRPEWEPSLYDLIHVYLARMLEVFRGWSEPKSIIRFTDEHYRDDLRVAIEQCGLTWNESRYESGYRSTATEQIDKPVGHPVQALYEHWLSLCPTAKQDFISA